MALTDEGTGSIPATMLVGPANIGGAGMPYPYPVMGGFGGSNKNIGIGCADGRIGKALEILDSPDTVEADRQIIENILSAMRTGSPYSELYNAISQLPQKRADYLF